MERTNPPKPRLSENLSSDSLFTFTPKLEYLISMLERGIYPRYICERIPIPNRSWYYTVAAKCFCDIPLGMIKSHLNWFGNYGLGIKKSFLKEQGASPIIYIHNKSRWIVDSLIEGGLKKTRSYPTLPFLKRLNGQDY
ncbi:MAG TPA: abortive infection system antitoxin AbiGi family protein, partial [Bacteroidales bacterium]|nr:abortive infection system antitoxin AbiGi family protein [Bacteroidales bacterium]